MKAWAFFMLMLLREVLRRLENPNEIESKLLAIMS
jgi:hypothetical protein